MTLGMEGLRHAVSRQKLRRNLSKAVALSIRIVGHSNLELYEHRLGVMSPTRSGGKNVSARVGDRSVAGVEQPSFEMIGDPAEAMGAFELDQSDYEGERDEADRLRVANVHVAIAILIGNPSRQSPVLSRDRLLGVLRFGDSHARRDQNQGFALGVSRRRADEEGAAPEDGADDLPSGIASRQMRWPIFL